MKLHLDGNPGAHRITAYGPGYVMVDKEKVTRSAVVMPSKLLLDWPPKTYDELTVSHLTMLADLKPEIVLLGTGSHQRFPATPLLSEVIERGIGVEFMNTAAACRTYNILMSEGRTVAAALFMIQ